MKLLFPTLILTRCLMFSQPLYAADAKILTETTEDSKTYIGFGLAQSLPTGEIGDRQRDFGFAFGFHTQTLSQTDERPLYMIYHRAFVNFLSGNAGSRGFQQIKPYESWSSTELNWSTGMCMERSIITLCPFIGISPTHLTSKKSATSLINYNYGFHNEWQLFGPDTMLALDLLRVENNFRSGGQIEAYRQTETVLSINHLINWSNSMHTGFMPKEIK